MFGVCIFTIIKPIYMARWYLSLYRQVVLIHWHDSLCIDQLIVATIDRFSYWLVSPFSMYLLHVSSHPPPDNVETYSLCFVLYVVNTIGDVRGCSANATFTTAD